MVKVKKADLAKLIEAKTKEFLTYGGEVVRYASLSKPDPIKLGAPPIVPKPGENEREAEWLKFIEALESGTYAPPADAYREREPEPRKFVFKKPTRGDGRGFKTIKGHGPKWK
ncbi:MAG: hypothetical protein ACREA9_21130 [Pyrinomonadaceae bacterium]